MRAVPAYKPKEVITPTDLFVLKIYIFPAARY